MSITLVHGTSRSHLDSIMEMGLRPRYKPNWTSPGKVPGFPGIYLTKDSVIAEWYALRAAIVDLHDQYGILECQVEEDQLYPDENFLAKSTKGLVKSEDMTEAVANIYDNKHRWQESLTKIGVVHQGTILPDAIQVIKTGDIVNNHWYWTVEDTRTINEMDIKLKCFNVAQATRMVKNPLKQKIIIIGDLTPEASFEVVDRP